MTVAQPLIELDASYARAVPRLSVPWTAAPVPAPELLLLNAELAEELDLDPAALRASRRWRRSWAANSISLCRHSAAR